LLGDLCFLSLPTQSYAFFSSDKDEKHSLARIN